MTFMRPEFTNGQAAKRRNYGRVVAHGMAWRFAEAGYWYAQCRGFRMRAFLGGYGEWTLRIFRDGSQVYREHCRSRDAAFDETARWLRVYAAGGLVHD